MNDCARCYAVFNGRCNVYRINMIVVSHGVSEMKRCKYVVVLLCSLSDIFGGFETILTYNSIKWSVDLQAYVWSSYER